MTTKPLVIKMKTKRSKKEKPMPPDDGHVWENAGGKYLKPFDVLRTLRNEEHPEKGWLYSLCTGGGFGCDPTKMGNAIFTTEIFTILDPEKPATFENLTPSLEGVLALKERKIISPSRHTNEELPDGFYWNECRWEKRWNIEIMVR
jgi:hypothetical protein